jgi:hypothetical protein
MKFVALIPLLMACVGCTRADQSPPKGDLRELANTFVPTDARDRHEADEVPWVQISFEVTRAPGEFAIALEELRKAQRAGWLLCEPTTSNWTEFEDLRLQPSRYVAEQSYMLHKGHTLVVLLGAYEFENEAAWKRAREESTTKLAQHAVVIAQPSTEEDARTRAAAQGLQCQ